MWGLRHILRSISRGVANTMAACIVCTRLDYCNALLQVFTDKLQIVQNTLTRVVCNVTTRQQHTIDLLHNRHWFSIRSRITFKSSTLCYKATGSINQAICSKHWSYTCQAVNWHLLRWTCWQFLSVNAVAYQNRCTPFRQQFGTYFHCPSVTLTVSQHSSRTSKRTYSVVTF